MPRLLIENRILKPLIFIFGVLLTIATLCGSLYGFALGFAGVKEFDFWLISLGLVTIFSLVGIFGAWYRYYKSLSSLSSSQRNKVRHSLSLGILASIYLSCIAFYNGFGWPVSLFFIVLAFIGYAFIYSTPK